MLILNRFIDILNGFSSRKQRKSILSCRRPKNTHAERSYWITSQTLIFHAGCINVPLMECLNAWEAVRNCFGNIYVAKIAGWKWCLKISFDSPRIAVIYNGVMGVASPLDCRECCSSGLQNVLSGDEVNFYPTTQIKTATVVVGWGNYGLGWGGICINFHYQLVLPCTSSFRIIDLCNPASQRLSFES